MPLSFPAAYSKLTMLIHRSVKIQRIRNSIYRYGDLVFVCVSVGVRADSVYFADALYCLPPDNHKNLYNLFRDRKLYYHSAYSIISSNPNTDAALTSALHPLRVAVAVAMNGIHNSPSFKILRDCHRNHRVTIQSPFSFYRRPSERNHPSDFCENIFSG